MSRISRLARVCLLGVVALLGGCKTGSGDPPDAAGIDASLPDAGPSGRTAVFVSDIATFAAVGDTYTKVAYAVEDIDDLDEFDPSTHRFTPVVAGDYHVCASLFKPIFQPFAALAVVKNDTGAPLSFAHNPWFPSGCTTVRLAAGDFIDVRVLQGPAPLTFDPDPFGSWLSIHRVDGSVFADTSSQFTAADSTFVTVIYDREELDDAGEFNPATSRFTSAVADDVQVCASASNDATYFVFELDTFVNGVRERGISFQGGRAPGCGTVRLGAGDTVEVRASQRSGAIVTYAGFPEASWISIARRDAQVSAGVGGAFTVLDATISKVPFSAEIFDDGGEYDPAASRFTSAAGGDYEVCAALQAPDNTFGFELNLYKNDTREKAFAFGADRVAGCRAVRLAAGEYVEVFLRNESGASRTFAPSLDWGWLTIDKL